MVGESEISVITLNSNMPIIRQLRIYSEVIDHMLFRRKKLQYEYYINFEMFYKHNSKLKVWKLLSMGVGFHTLTIQEGEEDYISEVNLTFLMTSRPVSPTKKTISKSKNIKCVEEYKMKKLSINVYLK